VGSSQLQEEVPHQKKKERKDTMDEGERREERGKAFWLREPQISHDCAGAVRQQLEPLIQLHPFLLSVALVGMT